MTKYTNREGGVIFVDIKKSIKMDSGELKEKLEQQKFKPKDDKDVVILCFNRGIDTAIKLIEIYEDSATLRG